LDQVSKIQPTLCTLPQLDLLSPGTIFSHHNKNNVLLFTKQLDLALMPITLKSMQRIETSV